MKEIQMVDLQAQYAKIKPEMDNAIKEVIDNATFINGPIVKEFKKNLEEYLEVKHVIPCANGTDALQIAMMALDLKPGDEIITSNFTFVATVEVIALLGLKLVLVDVDPKTFCIDPKEIRKAITKNTKVIVPVHLFGQSSDMEEIMNIANEHNLFVIEDVAQAIGCEYTFKSGHTKKVGTIGDIACTSFFPSKNLGCFGDGGAIMTNNDLYAAKLQQIINHGSSVKYHHQLVGVNSRLDSIQAAILNVKLPYLEDYNKARQNSALFYNEAFKNCQYIETPFINENSTHVFHQYTLVIKNGKRDELKKYLDTHKIPNAVYYPIALSLQEAYRELGYKKGDFPVTEFLCENVISLPMHTELDNEQLIFITNTLLDYFIKH